MVNTIFDSVSRHLLLVLTGHLMPCRFWQIRNLRVPIIRLTTSVRSLMINIPLSWPLLVLMKKILTSRLRVRTSPSAAIAHRKPLKDWFTKVWRQGASSESLSCLMTWSSRVRLCPMECYTLGWRVLSLNTKDLRKYHSLQRRSCWDNK